jgi:hypothetical protein
VSRPPRTFRSAKDIDEERLVNALRRSASAGSVRPRTAVVLLGAGRCWCWRCRAVGSVEEHRHEPEERGDQPRQ